MKIRSIFWLVGLLACSDIERQPELEELRISTHRGLDPPVPPTGQTMTASLFEMVCPLVRRSWNVRGTGDGVFELRPKASSERSLADASKLLRHVRLKEVRPAGDHLVVKLDPDGDPGMMCLEDGPYRVASYTPSELVFERRGTDGLARIRVLNVRDSEEEWRRFLAREVDILPGVNRSQVRYVRELPSIRLTEVESSASIGLIFHVRNVPLDIRRAIALGIHRSAVARALGLPESSAIKAPEDPIEAERLIAAHRPISPIRIITYQGDADMRRAALILEENLSRIGMSPRIDALDIEGNLEKLTNGEWDVQLFFADYIETVWERFGSDSSMNSTGYSNPDFNAAVAAMDRDRIRAIMERDVLIVPLFRVPDVIASDRRLCGIRPDLLDLMWLSGVHVCAPNETE